MLNDLSFWKLFTISRVRAMQASHQAQSLRDSKPHFRYTGNRVLIRDLFKTLRNDLDRSIIATRDSIPGSRRLSLVGKQCSDSQ